MGLQPSGELLLGRLRAGVCPPSISSGVMTPRCSPTIRRTNSAGKMRSSRQSRYLVGTAGQSASGQGSRIAFDTSGLPRRSASAASSGGTPL